MFEHDVSELVSSFEQWTDFEVRLQQSLAGMESSEGIQDMDSTSEIKQVYASITKASKAIEKVRSHRTIH